MSKPVKLCWLKQNTEKYVRLAMIYFSKQSWKPLRNSCLQTKLVILCWLKQKLMKKRYQIRFYLLILIKSLLVETKCILTNMLVKVDVWLGVDNSFSLIMCQVLRFPLTAEQFVYECTRADPQGPFCACLYTSVASSSDSLMSVTSG